MQLVEIKKNNTGTGLLIENDGYISMEKNGEITLSNRKGEYIDSSDSEQDVNP